MSKQAIEDGKIPNEDLARKLHGPVTNVVYVVICINTFAFLLSYKCLRITKLYFYSCILLHALEVFIPREETPSVARQHRNISIATQYVMAYFNFWSDTILAMLVPMMN